MRCPCCGAGSNRPHDQFCPTVTRPEHEVDAWASGWMDNRDDGR